MRDDPKEDRAKAMVDVIWAICVDWLRKGGSGVEDE